MDDSIPSISSAVWQKVGGSSLSVGKSNNASSGMKSSLLFIIESEADGSKGMSSSEGTSSISSTFSATFDLFSFISFSIGFSSSCPFKVTDA